MATITVRVVTDYDAMSAAAADIVAEVITTKPTCALCVPTGNTPLGMFQRLIDRVERGEISFAGNQLFCLDEYVGIDEEDPESLTRWLNRSFLEPARVSEGNIHTLPTTAGNLEAAAAAYEREIADAGGLELAVLGLGGNGHIAYNEPGSTGDSRTRVLTLTDESIEQAEGYFEGRTVPTEAMTVGVGHPARGAAAGPDRLRRRQGGDPPRRAPRPDDRRRPRLVSPAHPRQGPDHRRRGRRRPPRVAPAGQRGSNGPGVQLGSVGPSCP
jgi:glucosamine-6-phosphate isomerase